MSKAVTPASGSPELPAVGATVTGRVQGLVKGGFEVVLGDGAQAYCPLGHMDFGRVEDQSRFLGQLLEFRVLEAPPAQPRIVLSRRKILEEESRVRRAEARRKLAPGAVVSGRITRISEFGAMVDLGGIDGSLHVSEVSHRRIARLADVLQVGQEVQVLVKRLEPRADRASVSMKALEPDPWADIETRLRTWDVVDGKILRAAEFGAFLELVPGVEGLLHRSELPAGALARIEEAARDGAIMSVVVLEVDPARRRVGLAPAPRGMAPGDRWQPIALKAGAIVTGRVEEVKPFGVCLRLGPGQTAVIGHADMGTPRGAEHKIEFPPGTEISAEVLSVEAGGRRAKLSRAKAMRREERAELEQHVRSQGSSSLSTLGDLLEQARARASAAKPSSARPRS